jgi:hypothetical protein
MSPIVDQRYPALGAACQQAALFEREIAEQCAVLPRDIRVSSRFAPPP